MKTLALLMAVAALAAPAAALADDGSVRAVPTTFDEFTENHEHGVVTDRVALFDDTVFAAHDSAGGYYGANEIQLQQDPRTAVACLLCR